MALKRGAAVDYGRNEIQNAVIQNLAAAPSSPVKGLVYFDTTLNQFGYYNGSTWIYSTSAPNATAGAPGLIQLAGDIGGTATSPTVTGLHLAADTAVNHKLTNVTDPTAAQDAATKQYVDNAIQGLSPKTAARVATTGAETYTIAAGAVTQISGTAIDGVTLAVNDLILVKNAPAASGVGTGSGTSASTQPANGIYVVTNATTNLTVQRAPNADAWAEMVGALVPIDAGGATTGDTVWLSTTTPGGTLNTTAVSFTYMQSALSINGDGTYITKSGNTIQPVAPPVDPTAGANGSVVATAAALRRQMKFAIKGDGSTTSFTCTHNFGVRMVTAQGWTDSGGNPAAPIELDFSPTSANAIAVAFPVAPVAGTIYYVAVAG